MRKVLSIAASLVLCSVAANAVGTTAGTTVSNSATLSYTVSGAVQPTVSTPNAATFIVDKKIDFSLVHNDAIKHLITTSGATSVKREFVLENTTNKAQSFALTATNLTGNESYDSKVDDTDITNIEISLDGGGSWVSGTVTISNLGVDTTKTILVRGDVPNTNVDGSIMNIQLEAIAVTSGTNAEVVTGSGSDGTLSSDRKDTEDVVLGEGSGVTTFANVQFDGKYSAWAGYFINSPVLTLTKTSCVYKDIVNGVSSNAKRIPGATITYLLDIENTGSIDASDINITDVLPSELDGSTVTAVKMNDNQADCVCTNGTAGAGTDATVSVSGQTVNVSSLTTLTSKHNCVTLQVDIK